MEAAFQRLGQNEEVLFRQAFVQGPEEISLNQRVQNFAKKVFRQISLCRGTYVGRFLIDKACLENCAEAIGAAILSSYLSEEKQENICPELFATNILGGWMGIALCTWLMSNENEEQLIPDSFKTIHDSYGVKTSVSICAVEGLKKAGVLSQSMIAEFGVAALAFNFLLVHNSLKLFYIYCFGNLLDKVLPGSLSSADRCEKALKEMIENSPYLAFLRLSAYDESLKEAVGSDRFKSFLDFEQDGSLRLFLNFYQFVEDQAPLKALVQEHQEQLIHNQRLGSLQEFKVLQRQIFSAFREQIGSSRLLNAAIDDFFENNPLFEQQATIVFEKIQKYEQKVLFGASWTNSRQKALIAETSKLDGRLLAEYFYAQKSQDLRFTQERLSPEEMKKLYKHFLNVPFTYYETHPGTEMATKKVLNFVRSHFFGEIERAELKQGALKI